MSILRTGRIAAIILAGAIAPAAAALGQTIFGGDPFVAGPTAEIAPSDDPVILGPSDESFTLAPGASLPGDSSEVLIGPSHSSADAMVWRSFHESGWDAVKGGRLDLAEKLFRAALQEAQRHGNRGSRMATTYYDLAWIFVLREKPEQAAPLAQWSLETREALLGPNHPEVADSLLLSARIAAAMKRYDQAEQMARRALRIYLKSNFGPEDKHPPYALDVLGDIRELKGDYAEAESLFLRALNMRENALGLSYKTPFLTEEDVASSYRRLAQLMRKMGREEEAKILEQRASDIIALPAEPGAAAPPAQ